MSGAANREHWPAWDEGSACLPDAHELYPSYEQASTSSFLKTDRLASTPVSAGAASMGMPDNICAKQLSQVQMCCDKRPSRVILGTV